MERFELEGILKIQLFNCYLNMNLDLQNEDPRLDIHIQVLTPDGEGNLLQQLQHNWCYNWCSVSINWDRLFSRACCTRSIGFN